MKKILFFSIVASSLLLSSCGIHNEATSNLNQVQTSVVLSQNNYKVIGTATGESKQCYVLGIGGLTKLNQSAMSEMYKNADLKGGARAIINPTIQYKNQFYVLWAKRKAIATGTIIEFVK
ncbi:MAG: hypothetical protein Q4E59_02080 [Bacteroidales bacterium]|nr:hypothetical protein [Bacteroidales bacterium]